MTDANALADAVASVVQAISAGDETALEAQTTPAAWASEASVADLLRQAERFAASAESLGTVHSATDRSAVRMGWVVRGEIRREFWLLFLGAEPLLAGWTREDNEAWLFVDGQVDEAPTWSGLARTSDAVAFVQAAVPTIGTAAPAPEGSDPQAWQQLIAPVDPAYLPEIKEVRALPGGDRAIVQLRFMDPADPDYPAEERYPVLARRDGVWCLVAVRSVPGLHSLLYGVIAPWPAPPKPNP